MNNDPRPNEHTLIPAARVHADCSLDPYVSEEDWKSVRCVTIRGEGGHSITFLGHTNTMRKIADFIRATADWHDREMSRERADADAAALAETPELAPVLGGEA